MHKRLINLVSLIKTIFIVLIFVSCSGSIDDNVSETNGGDDNSTEIVDPTEYKDVVVNRDEWDKEKRGNITYQMLMYSFADSNGDGIGDINGLINKLDYIDELGVSAIWISPIHPCSSYHGYDVLDYSSVNPDYGTISDFKTLVNDAHAKGIKIYLDYVLNHTSSKCDWFTNATSSKDSPYRSYYIFSSDPQADITDGKIAMINTEGSSGYDSGQWFATSTSSDSEKNYEFFLDWTDEDAPTITISATTNVDDDNPDTSTEFAKYLYFGDSKIKKFYNIGNNQYRLRVSYSSDWGFLIRTSSTEWEDNTKYGSQNENDAIKLGVPFTLYTSTESNDIFNILTSGIQTTYYHSHFWTSSFADLNYGAVDTCQNSDAYKSVVDAAKVWFQAGIDGFRLDAVKHIYHNAYSDENPTFLNKFYTDINQIYKDNGHSDDVYMVGEVLSEASEVAPYYKGLPALFEFSFWYRLKYALNNNIGCYFAKDILGYETLYSSYRQNYIEATKLSNHDENRTGSDLGGSVAKEKQAAAILLTAPGQPYIYYGEELGYIGTKDNGDEYVRSPMYWGDNYVTSYTDKIYPGLKTKVGSVLLQEADSTSVLYTYKDFAEARNEYPALANGEMSEHSIYNENASADFPAIAAWYMTYGDQTMLILHNLGNDAKILPLAKKDVIKKAVALLGSAQIKTEDSESTVKLGANSSVVFELK